MGRVTLETYSGVELWDRPHLSRDRADLKTGQFVALICYSTDRLSRDPIHLAIIAEECERAGVELHFVSETFDDSDEAALIRYVKGYSSKKEREKIRERTLRGKHTRALMGKLHNSGPEKYGWRRDRERGVRAIEEREASVLQEMFRRIGLERWSLHRMAVDLKRRREPTPRASVRGELPGTDDCLWRARTVQRIIRDPAYRGETIAWQWRSAPMQPGKLAGRGATVIRRPEEEHIRLPEGITPPIVSPELWFAANQAVESQDGSFARNMERPYLLRGRIRCALCRMPMQPSWHYRSGGNPDSGRVYTYRCSSHRAPNTPCAGKVVPADAIDAWVWDEVTKRIRHPELIAAEARRRQQEGVDPNIEKDLVIARRHVREYKRQQKRLVQRYASAGDDSRFPWELVEQEVERLDAQKRQWEEAIDEIKERIARQERAKARMEWLVEYCELVAANLGAFDFSARCLALDAFGVTVMATGKNQKDWDIDGLIPLHAMEEALAEAVGDAMEQIR